MKQAIGFLLLLVLAAAVQGLDFEDDRSRSFRWPRYKKKPGPGSPPSWKKPAAPPKPAPPSRDGLVAPLTRLNIPGISVPYFVVELKVGDPPVAVNFTVDTMGRHTALPWELCSNATEKKPTIAVDDRGGNDDKKKPPVPWLPPSRPSEPPPTSPPSRPGSPPVPPSRPSTPPPASPVPWLPPSRPGSPPPVPSSPSGAATVVPCSHPVCKPPSFTCDKVRQRCTAYDRYTGKPIDLVLSKLTMKSVDPSGAEASGNRTIAGIVMGCSVPTAVPYVSTSMVSLSPDDTSLVSQLAAAGNLPRRFAYCLGKPRGAFFFGGAEYVFRQQGFKPQMQYLPMVSQPTAWQRGMGYRLALRGIAVGYGTDVTPLPIDPSLFDNGVVIGTKLRYMTLVDPAYQVVRRHFMEVAASAVANSSITPVASPFPELNLCYRIPTRAAVTRAPNVQFIFENATLTIYPRNYIVRWRRTETVCLGIVGAGPLGRVSVIGTLQQEETLVEYDLDKKVVGVSEQLTAVGTSCNFENFAPAPAPGFAFASEDDGSLFDEDDGDLFGEDDEGGEEVGSAPSPF